MSRRVVIIILGILILGVIGGTVFLVMSRLRQDTEPTDTGDGTGSLSEAPTGGQQVIDPTGDEDDDGLINADEALWGTDRTNPDTDGDGFLDGEEVSAGHNPTIAAPNDLLPEGFTPGREITPLDTAQDQSVIIESFFEENLNLDPIGPNRNLSNEFRSRYSVSERTATTVREFVSEQQIVAQLPQPNPSLFTITENNSSEAIQTYVKTAGNLNLLSNRELLATALNQAIATGDISGIQAVLITINLYQESLLEIETVPSSAVPLHNLLLGYTQLLKATLEQMTLWTEDEIRGLLAVRQLEVIDAKYFPVIRLQLVQVAETSLQN